MRRAAAGENSHSGYGYGQSHIEEENDRQENLLSEKVKALKSLTIDIGDEVRFQNNMLKGMDDDFDRGSGFLSATMNRLNAIAKSSGNWHICYLLLFCVAVFVFLWLFLKFR